MFSDYLETCLISSTLFFWNSLLSLFFYWEMTNIFILLWGEMIIILEEISQEKIFINLSLKNDIFLTRSSHNMSWPDDILLRRGVQATGRKTAPSKCAG